VEGTFAHQNSASWSRHGDGYHITQHVPSVNESGTLTARWLTV